MTVRTCRGFTLLEICIAVAIILIVVGLIGVAFMKLKKAVEALDGSAAGPRPVPGWMAV